MKIFASHGRTDSLPTFRRKGSGATTVEPRLQVGVNVNLDPGDPARNDPGDKPYTQPKIQFGIEVSTDAGLVPANWQAIPITRAYLRQLSRTPGARRAEPGLAERMYPYLDIAKQLARNVDPYTANRYLELIVSRLPHGTALPTSARPSVMRRSRWAVHRRVARQHQTCADLT